MASHHWSRYALLPDREGVWGPGCQMPIIPHVVLHYPTSAVIPSQAVCIPMLLAPLLLSSLQPIPFWVTMGSFLTNHITNRFNGVGRLPQQNISGGFWKEINYNVTIVFSALWVNCLFCFLFLSFFQQNPFWESGGGWILYLMSILSLGEHLCCRHWLLFGRRRGWLYSEEIVNGIVLQY